MKDLEKLLIKMKGTDLEPWMGCLKRQVELAMSPERNSRIEEWQEVIDGLEDVKANIIDLETGAVKIVPERPLTEKEFSDLDQSLKALMPWRKGPYDIHGVYVDTEWRSDFKWDRLKGAIKPLHGRTVLDVGCGNGYHGWRMIGEGAELVIGVDPSPLFAMQFSAVKHFIGERNIFLLPLGIEDVPDDLRAFDTVFSMGVFYHRRSPIDHLYQLRQCLKPGGQLVLETLVIEGDEMDVLLPGDRYAQMRNVWFIPSSQAMMKWMRRCGYKNIRLVDESYTEFEEQRATEWMQYHSLSEFLDADDKRKTIEGYPAPLRAIFTADAP